jgi:hypothetical protein
MTAAAMTVYFGSLLSAAIMTVICVALYWQQQ